MRNDEGRGNMPQNETIQEDKQRTSQSHGLFSQEKITPKIGRTTPADCSLSHMRQTPLLGTTVCKAGFRCSRSQHKRLSLFLVFRCSFSDFKCHYMFLADR